MKKRILSVLLSALLVIFLLPVAAEAGTLSNFSKVNAYTSGQFTDVSNEWFAQYVQASYEYNLMNGTSATTFSPGNNLTIAEAIKLAACLHSIYNTGAANFSSGSPWYQPYVDYALQNGIIAAPYANYAATATRSDFAVIFAAALPDEALTAMNSIDDNVIPDVQISYSYGPAVYKLYRAGILTGSDTAGTFKPTSFIQRSEVAAITARMANVSFRQSVTLVSGGEEAAYIAAKCSSAVFYIELYDADGEKFGSGSGFFIESSGIAVTNFHVIELASSAKITTKYGNQYDITGFLGYDEQKDLAIIQVDGSGFPTLSVGNTNDLVTGSSVYAIGYPRGIDQTISSGIITNISHEVNGVNHFMIDAAISPGSSGGALVNSSGQVVGVTRASYVNGQNLNLAVPIDLLSSITRGSVQPLSTLNTVYINDVTFYNGYYPAPTFTSITNVPLYSFHDYSDYSQGYNAGMYIYDAENMTMNIDDAIDVYVKLLRACGFSYDSTGSATNGIRTVVYRYYYNYATDIVVGVAKDRYDSNDYIRVYLFKLR